MNTKILWLVTFSLTLIKCTPVDERSLYEGIWVDLTHEFSDETLYWPTSESFHIDTVFAGYTEHGFYYEAHHFCTAEHGGTHLDAPIHFAEGKMSVHEINPDRLIGDAVVIDVSDQVDEYRDYQILIEDMEAWEREYGTIPDHSILLFNTGFSDYWPDAELYLGTDSRGEGALEELSFPGIHPETARWIVDHRQVKAVGLDTPSLDYGQSVLFETHQILFEENIPGLENVANLNRLPAVGAFVVALPMKIRDGSGAPLRIVALIPDDN